jgi:hypothetical protein
MITAAVAAVKRLIIANTPIWKAGLLCGSYHLALVWCVKSMAVAWHQHGRTVENGPTTGSEPETRPPKL